MDIHSTFYRSSRSCRQIYDVRESQFVVDKETDESSGLRLGSFYFLVFIHVTCVGKVGVISLRGILVI